MAMLKLCNGKYVNTTPERATRWWSVLNGEVDPTDQEAIKASQIERVYLNVLNPLTPQSYKDMYQPIPDSFKGTLGAKYV